MARFCSVSGYLKIPRTRKADPRREIILWGQVITVCSSRLLEELRRFVIDDRNWVLTGCSLISLGPIVQN